MVSFLVLRWSELLKPSTSPSFVRCSSEQCWRTRLWIGLIYLVLFFWSSTLLITLRMPVIQATLDFWSRTIRLRRSCFKISWVLLWDFLALSPALWSPPSRKSIAKRCTEKKLLRRERPRPHRWSITCWERRQRKIWLKEPLTAFNNGNGLIIFWWIVLEKIVLLHGLFRRHKVCW